MKEVGRGLKRLGRNIRSVENDDAGVFFSNPERLAKSTCGLQLMLWKENLSTERGFGERRGAQNRSDCYGALASEGQSSSESPCRPPEVDHKHLSTSAYAGKTLQGLTLGSSVETTQPSAAQHLTDITEALFVSATGLDYTVQVGTLRRPRKATAPGSLVSGGGVEREAFAGQSRKVPGLNPGSAMVSFCVALCMVALRLGGGFLRILQLPPSVQRRADWAYVYRDRPPRGRRITKVNDNGSVILWVSIAIAQPSEATGGRCHRGVLLGPD
ncbi:unnamed protein product [Pleuronectes platessa]|uniref:Uncharacterized protein n=1 Tax=Pleuronectes platessa TaxID=8262 RepID=A0A9N7Z5U1_PLEPL|nr:unnamed protein product [Pleuronectes platessa]